MGMFDTVKKFKMPCPLCKTEINNFQSKSGPCELLYLEAWEFEDFYAGCENCDLWIVFHVLKDEHATYIIPTYMDLQDTPEKIIKHWSKPDWEKILTETGLIKKEKQ